METILTIRPARQSNILKDIRANVLLESTDPNGIKTQRNLGNFEGRVIPGIVGGRRIRWNPIMRKYPTGTLELDELQKAVAACKFRNDIYGHPDKGKLITSADPYDFNDPFFINKQAMIRLEESFATLKSNTPFEKIFSKYITEDGNYNVNQSGSSSSRNAKFEVIDADTAVSSGQKTRLRSQKATKLVENLSDDKKVKAAMYLGLIPNESTDRQLIDDVLWKICIGTDAVSEAKKDILIGLCELPTEKLTNRYLIAKARQRGFLKKTKAGNLLKGVNIGTTDFEVETYFDNVDNQNIIDILEKDLNTRPKESKAKEQGD